MNHSRFLCVTLAMALVACSSSSPSRSTGGSGGSTPAGGTSGSGGSGGSTGGSGGSGGTSSGGSGGTPATGGSGGTPATGGSGGGQSDAGQAADAAVAKDGGAAGDGASSGDGPAPVGMAIPPAGANCPAGPFGNPLPASTVATVVKMNAGSLEGPVWVAAQNTLYFCVVGSGAADGRIDKYVPATNTVSTFAMGLNVAGLAIPPDGMGIVAAAFDQRNLSRFDLTSGARTVVPNSDKYAGKNFNQLNDVIARSDGNYYFTDTNYRQDGRAGQETTAYYRLSRTGEVTRLGTGPQPNGITLSPDGHYLYVSFTEGGEPVRRHTLDDSGASTAMSMFFNATSDGMSVDCAGNVYLSNGGAIRVVSPAGMLLGSITGLGGATVANSAFGGDDRKTLFITTAAALYSIKMNVPGMPD